MASSFTHRAFRTGERRDSWSGEPSGTSISSPQKARLECGFQQGGGAVSFVTRERHSLLPRHPWGRSPLSHSEPTPTASGPAKETAIEGQHAGFVRCRSALNYGLTDRPACRSCTVGGYWGGGLPLRGRLSTVNCHMAI